MLLFSSKDTANASIELKREAGYLIFKLNSGCGRQGKQWFSAITAVFIANGRENFLLLIGIFHNSSQRNNLESNTRLLVSYKKKILKISKKFPARILLIAQLSRRKILWK